jgi:hypothetical protein
LKTLPHDYRVACRSYALTRTTRHAQVVDRPIWQRQGWSRAASQWRIAVAGRARRRGRRWPPVEEGGDCHQFRMSGLLVSCLSDEHKRRRSWDPTVENSVAR